MFFAANEAAFGEVVYGRRIALELAARGIRSVVVAPRAHGRLLEDVEHVELSPEEPRPDRRARDVVRASRADALILLDATTVFVALEQRGISSRWLDRLDTQVIAHDLWNLRVTGIRIDFGPGYWPIPDAALSVERRLLPVPCSLSKSPGAYYGMPQAPALGRTEARRSVGVRSSDRIVLMATAWFQEAGLHSFVPIRRWARKLPSLLAQYFRRLPRNIRLVHVGPRGWPALRRALADRYVPVRALAPQDFARWMAAADAFLSFNATASSIASAMVADVPVILGTSSGEVDGYHPFYIWPCGFRSFLDPLLERNPYARTLESVEVFDADSFVETLGGVSRGRDWADRIRHRQARYVASVQRLPTAAELIEQWLAR